MFLVPAITLASIYNGLHFGGLIGIWTEVEGGSAYLLI